MSRVRTDVVQSVLVGNPDEPIEIHFRKHAAVYFLDRTHPKFIEWLELLERSRRERVRVAFTYAVEGQRLTLVEAAE